MPIGNLSIKLIRRMDLKKLRGKVRVTTHRDDGSVIEDVVLCAEEGRYGVNIPKGVWHTIEAMEADSVIFECKEGPFVPHDAEGILKG